MTITTQYLDATRRIQDTWFAAFDAASAQASRAFETPVTAPVAEPRRVVADWFDFAEKALRVQRETALRVIAANDEITSQWREQAQHVQDTWTQQAKVATDTLREQSESFVAAGREQAQQYGEAFENRARDFATATQEQARKVTDAVAANTRRLSETAAQATTQATRTAAQATTRATEATAQAATEAAEKGAQAAKRNYTLMNSAQLKSELASRGLPATGTLDEMRNRLRENDAKA